MRARALVAAVGAIAVLTGACGPQRPADGTPLEARLNARMAAWAERGGVPAATAVIRVGGEEVWRRALSTAPDAQLRVASITKLLLATVVMDLVEDELLDLDTSVADLLGPGFDGITVAHLLRHTSGLPDYGTEDFTRGLRTQRDRRWQDREVLSTILSATRPFPPGGGWEYSNSNYLALAVVIEEVTGATWVEELRSRVLDPLELHDTYVAGFESPRGAGLINEAYFDLDNDGEVEDVEQGAWPALETSESAAGAVVSTAPDVAVFTEALFTGRILQPRTVEQMVSASAFARRYDDYGLGVELRRPDLQTPAWGHGGHLPGYRSVTWYVPAEDATITILANHSMANPPDLATLLLDELG